MAVGQSEPRISWALFLHKAGILASFANVLYLPLRCAHYATKGVTIIQFRIDRHVITVNTPSSEALLNVVRDRLKAGRGLALATLNLDHLVNLRRDPEFRKAYAAQDLVVADGNPVVWLSKLARRPVHLAPGSDLVVALAETAAETASPIALVGSTEPALDAAATALKERVPGLQVATCLAPPMGFDPSSAEADAILDQLAASGARMCFLALGAPKQEVFAARGRARTPNIAFVSIGAGLDFLGGRQKRAPALVRKVALEWLWRAVTAPRRMIPRYLSCFAILPSEILAALRQRGVF